MSGVRAAVDRVIAGASTASLKRIAWAFGCARKQSDEERQLRDLLLDRAKQELDAEHRARLQAINTFAMPALEAAQTALYDAMHAGNLSREYHDSVINRIEGAIDMIRKELAS